MEENARYHVVKRDDGKYEVKLENSEHASAVTYTQAQAIEAGIQFAENKGNGNVFIHGQDGAIRDSVNIVDGKRTYTHPTK